MPNFAVSCNKERRNRLKDDNFAKFKRFSAFMHRLVTTIRIRPGTWAFIDERASRRKHGTLTRSEGRRIKRRINKALAADRLERALQAGHAIMTQVEAGKPREAWGVARAWHKEVDPAASPPLLPGA